MKKILETASVPKGPFDLVKVQEVAENHFTPPVHPSRYIEGYPPRDSPQARIQEAQNRPVDPGRTPRGCRATDGTTSQQGGGVRVDVPTSMVHPLAVQDRTPRAHLATHGNANQQQGLVRRDASTRTANPVASLRALRNTGFRYVQSGNTTSAMSLDPIYENGDEEDEDEIIFKPKNNYKKTYVSSETSGAWITLTKNSSTSDPAPGMFACFPH